MAKFLDWLEGTSQSNILTKYERTDIHVANLTEIPPTINWNMEDGGWDGGGGGGGNTTTPTSTTTATATTLIPTIPSSLPLPLL